MTQKVKGNVADKTNKVPDRIVHRHHASSATSACPEEEAVKEGALRAVEDREVARFIHPANVKRNYTNVEHAN
jgi:hypothetical protein